MDFTSLVYNLLLFNICMDRCSIKRWLLHYSNYICWEIIIPLYECKDDIVVIYSTTRLRLEYMMRIWKQMEIVGDFGRDVIYQKINEKKLLDIWHLNHLFSTTIDIINSTHIYIVYIDTRGLEYVWKF